VGSSPNLASKSGRFKGIATSSLSSLRISLSPPISLRAIPEVGSGGTTTSAGPALEAGGDWFLHFLLFLPEFLPVLITAQTP